MQPAHRHPGVVTANSRTHWSLLIAGLAGAVAFNATYLIDGATRPGYDWLSQPVSALSLGPGGTVQVVNFIAFGTLGCITALAWRLTLTGGTGETWYPRLAVLAGLAMICTGIFTLDPAHGYPPDPTSRLTPASTPRCTTSPPTSA